MKICHGDSNVAFMFSNWYSGATLLAILLNNHTQITCNGESFPYSRRDVNIYTCSCGMVLNQCEFYKNVAAHMIEPYTNSWNERLFITLPIHSQNIFLNDWLNSFRHFHNLRDFILEHVPLYQKNVYRYISSHMQFIENAMEYDKSLIYVDGTKSFRRAELFIKFSSRVKNAIHLVRDGRAFCYSYLKNRKLTYNEIDEAANAWKRYIDELDEFHSRYPNIAILTVRYEDLCKDINSAMDKVWDFLGVDREIYEPAKLVRPYHILGNRMRQAFSGYVRESVSWKSQLTERNISYLSEILKPELSRFDY